MHTGTTIDDLSRLVDRIAGGSKAVPLAGHGAPSDQGGALANIENAKGFCAKGFWSKSETASALCKMLREGKRNSNEQMANQAAERAFTGRASAGLHFLSALVSLLQDFLGGRTVTAHTLNRETLELAHLKNAIMQAVGTAEPIDAAELLETARKTHPCSNLAFAQSLVSLEEDGLLGQAEFRSVLTDKGRRYLAQLKEVIQ